MDIVLLCAGTSSRMGKTNKMLIPVGKTTMVANSAMQALEYLEQKDECSTLVIVTGYRRYSVEKALKECKQRLAETKAPLNMIIVHNKNYRKGQFTSVQTGVKKVQDDKPFFVALADMPKITSAHYKELENRLDGNDAVRASYLGNPGHPVLLNASMKEKILKASKNSKVSTILKKCNVNIIEKQDNSWTCDIDTEEDAKCLK